MATLSYPRRRGQRQRLVPRGSSDLGDLAPGAHLYTVNSNIADLCRRQAALIHLFQSIHRYGPHHTLLRHSLSQILSLIQRHDPSQSFEVNHTFTGSLLAAPLVLAAMIATAPDDREQCRQVLVSCGQQRGYADNLTAVERVWAVTDQSGWTVDWRDVLEKEGLMVAFL